MTGREVIRTLKDHKCTMLRQSGAHQRWASPSGHCKTIVSDHKGEDIKKGTLHAIQKDMEHCLGKGWLIP